MRLRTAFALMGAFALVATGAQAGLVNIGSGGINVNTKEVAKTVAKKGLEKAINDKMAKKNCHFVATKKDKVGTISCDINGIISELKNWHDGLEASIASDFDIHVESSHPTDSTIASQRATKVQSSLKSKVSWWDYESTYITTNGDNVKIWISVN